MKGVGKNSFNKVFILNVRAIDIMSVSFHSCELQNSIKIEGFRSKTRSINLAQVSLTGDLSGFKITERYE